MKTRPGDYDVEVIRKIVYERATPPQIRQALEIVKQLKLAGIRFVPIPVFNDEDFEDMFSKLRRRIDKIQTLINSNTGE